MTEMHEEADDPLVYAPKVTIYFRICNAPSLEIMVR